MSQEEIMSMLLNKKFLIAISTVIVSFVFYEIIKRLINRRINVIKHKSNTEISVLRKQKTYLKLSTSIIKYIIIIVDAIFVLQIYGVNVSSIITGVGVVSVISGLALQDALKDIIAGFNIIVDSYFSVGDVLEIENTQGKVTEITMKVTKLKDINNGNILVIANRNIVKAISLSNQFDIDIPIPYEESIEKIEALLNELVEKLKKNEKIDDVKYVGINQFGDSALIYKLRFWTLPENKPQLRRDVLGEIKRKLDANNIEIPYTQIDVHTKK